MYNNNQEYDEYIKEHRANVMAALHWLEENLDGIFDLDPDAYEFGDKDRLKMEVEHQCENHDQSKFDKEEYNAYVNYFYGDKNYVSTKDLNRAWLHHIHNNPHHWQYWVLINDNGGNRQIQALEMPYNYLIEMICDWWSFSFKSGNLYEIFDWYNGNKDNIILNDKTRDLVERILDGIKDELDFAENSNLTGEITDINDIE